MEACGRDVWCGERVAGGRTRVRRIHSAEIKSRGRAGVPAVTCFAGKQMLVLAKGGLRPMKETSVARAAPQASRDSRALSPPLPEGRRPGPGLFQGQEVVGR